VHLTHLSGPRLRRFVEQPGLELRRVAAYARTRDRRAAFLAFQRFYVSSQLHAVRSLRIAEIESELDLRNSPRTEITGPSIRRLLLTYGSDKATTHDYDVIYENLAKSSGVPRLVVEIGLGTTGRGPSSMGATGQPGASVRAFRDWGARVVGGDIDKSILLNEPGISTHFVDQLRPRTLAYFVKSLPGPIDLAIVDGLHTPEADLNSLIALAPHLSREGLLVIEDIESVPEVTSMWCLALSQLPQSFYGFLVATQASNVLFLRRDDNPHLLTLSTLYPASPGAICSSRD
jgi:hypothetical protein